MDRAGTKAAIASACVDMGMKFAAAQALEPAMPL
jgi:hypothetical protein